MIAVFYSGLEKLGQDGTDFYQELRLLAGDRALALAYIFLQLWQRTYYEFENSEIIAYRLAEMRTRADHHSLPNGAPARSR